MWWYLLIFVHIYSFVLICVDIRWCLFTFIGFCSYMFIFIHMLLYLLISVHIYWYLFIFVNIRWYVVIFVYRCWYLVAPYLFICGALRWFFFSIYWYLLFICSNFNYMWYYLCIFIDICSYSYICGDIYWYWLIFVDGRDFCLVSPIGVWRSSICHVFSLTNVGLHTLLLQNSL